MGGDIKPIYLGYECFVDSKDNKYICDRDTETVIAYPQHIGNIWERLCSSEINIKSFLDRLPKDLKEKAPIIESTSYTYPISIINGYLRIENWDYRDYYSAEEVINTFEAIHKFIKTSLRRDNGRDWLDFGDNYLENSIAVGEVCSLKRHGENSSIFIDTVSERIWQSKDHYEPIITIYNDEYRTSLYIKILRELFPYEIPLGTSDGSNNHNYVVHFEGSRFVVRKVENPGKFNIWKRVYYNEEEAYHILNLAGLCEKYRLWEEIQC